MSSNSGSDGDGSTSNSGLSTSTRGLQQRTARKSTASQANSSSTATSTTYATRRQAARNASKALKSSLDNYLGNFNPENSVRERRKLNRKIHPPTNVRRPAGALYDEHGIHIETATDLCDCLNEYCEGCFFECPKCKSQKCGTECRVHRKYVVEQIEYQGYDHTVNNPVLNKT